MKKLKLLILIFVCFSGAYAQKSAVAREEGTSDRKHQAALRKEQAAIKARDAALEIEYSNKAKAKKQKEDLEHKISADKKLLASLEEAKVNASVLALEEKQKKYKEKINKGVVQSVNKKSITPIKGKLNYQALNDRENKMYGIVLNGKKIWSLPFEGKETWIFPIENTALFEVKVNVDYEGYSSRYSHSYIVDASGKKLAINNTTIFKFRPVVKDNIIYMHQSDSEVKEIGKRACYNSVYDRVLSQLFQTPEAAEEALEATYVVGGGIVSGNYSIYSGKLFKLDGSLRLLEKQSGYWIRDDSDVSK